MGKRRERGESSSKISMKKKIFLIAVVSVWLAYSQGGGSQFFAKILRDGDYFLNFVNKENSLDKYAPSDLVELSSLSARGKYIRQAAYEKLAALLSDAKKAGVPVSVISAYRSYDRQKSIFAFWSSRYEDADRFSAEAGHSEHQLGTTIDFGLGDSSVDLDELFGGTPQGRWLSENAWKYGFAMSYPKDKEQITGYIYEPWHFRFIGIEEAGRWHASGLTLSEYLATKPQYYRLIRLVGDYKIYSVDTGGTKHWIKTSEKFLSLGYSWGDVVIVSHEEFVLYPEGGAIQ